MKSFLTTLLLITSSHYCIADYRYEISADNSSQELSLGSGQYYYSREEEKLRTAIKAHSQPVTLGNDPIAEASFLSKHSSFLLANTIQKNKVVTNTNLFSPVPDDFRHKEYRGHQRTLNLAYRGVIRSTVLVLETEQHLNSDNKSGDILTIGAGQYILDNAALTARFIRENLNVNHKYGLGINYRHYFATQSAFSFGLEVDSSSVDRTFKFESRANLYIGKASNLFFESFYAKTEGEGFFSTETFDSFGIGYQHYIGESFSALAQFKNGNSDSIELQKEDEITIGLKLLL